MSIEDELYDIVKASSARDEDPYEQSVASWEFLIVDAHDHNLIHSQEVMRGIAAHVWSAYGLSHPPLCEIREFRAERGALATGSRTMLTFYGPQTTSTLLHELAHAMRVSLERSTGDLTAKKDEHYPHGPGWLSVYLDLLDRFVPGLNKGYLMSTLPAIVGPVAWYPQILVREASGEGS